MLYYEGGKLVIHDSTFQHNCITSPESESLGGMIGLYDGEFSIYDTLISENIDCGIETDWSFPTFVIMARGHRTFALHNSTLYKNSAASLTIIFGSNSSTSVHNTVFDSNTVFSDEFLATIPNSVLTVVGESISIEKLL